MKRLRQYKSLFSFGLVILLTSAFSIKGLHHLGDHHHEPVCKEKNQKHLHSEHNKPDCPLCDFIFSLLTGSASIDEIEEPFYFGITISGNYSSIFHSASIITYSLRGPPAV